MLAMAIIAAALTGDAPPAAPVKHDWIARPSGDDVVREYPEEAARNGYNGFVRLHCKVLAGGHLNCVAKGEGKYAAAFEVAALRLSRRFRLNMANESTAPSQEIDLPIRFVVGADLLPDITLRDPSLKDGWAKVDCRVDVTGEIDDCGVLAEGPDGAGSGALAKALAVKMASGRRAHPSRFRVTMIFKSAPSPSPP